MMVLKDFKTARSRLYSGGLLFVLIFVLAQSVLAAQEKIQFRHLTAEDGLSHNTIHAIVQDPEGFLWFATRDGLNRFDGYEFVFYRNDPADPASLPHNSVTALALDGSRGIWVGTEGGVARFDFQTHSFQRIDWPRSRPVPVIHAMLQDHEGILWIASSSGLHQYDALNSRLTVMAPQANTPVIFESADRKIWCLTANRPMHCREVRAQATPETVALFRGILFDPRTPSNPLSDESGRPIRLPPGPEIAAFADAGDHLWVGTNLGLFLWDRDRNELREVPMKREAHALQRYIRSLYLDASGGLWVGTQGGLFYTPAQASPFGHFRLSEEPDPALPVSSIAEASDGGFWVGTYGHGLVRLAPEKNREIHEGPTTSLHSPGSGWIWSVASESDGTLWVVTSSGVDRLAPGGRWQSVQLPAQSELTPISHNAIVAHGSIWFLTRTHLFRLQTGSSRNTWAWEHYPLFPDDVNPEYEVIVADPEKPLIWLGGERLARFHLETAQLEPVPLRLGEQEIIKPQILDLHFSGGVLWIGSISGLFRLEIETGDLLHYAVPDGLPGSIVYSIESDANQVLWLGTSRGLCRFDPTAEMSRRFSSYGPQDGAGSLEFNRNASLASRDGTMLFGGLEGVTIFDPDGVVSLRGPPPVALTRIEHSNRELSTRVNPRGLQSLTLPYSEYTITFEFAALSFPNPSKQRYRYRLEPLEPNWIEADTRRFVQYTNLAAGRYHFRVLGSNEVGEWNLQGASLELIVTPPYWETWWFRSLMMAILTALAFAVYRYRLQRRLELERLRLRIAEDLHDHLSTDLSGIAVATNLVGARPGLDPDDQLLLSRIESTARKSVDSVRDIVWYVNPEHDRFSSLASRMRSVARSLLSGLDWEFVDDGADGAAISMRLRRELLPAYKEILHNILRHARASHVKIRLTADRHQLDMTIDDDGIGFSPQQTGDGTGLANLKRRVDRIGGQAAIRSNPGRGTQVHLSLPLPRTRDTNDR